MGNRLRCTTLFDVTKSGILSRNKPVDIDDTDWNKMRNSQCNLDTVIQAISLRSLPESCTDPILKHIRFKDFKNFGYAYKDEKKIQIPCWTFEFYVQSISVFYNGIRDLGYLYADCHHIPMIKCSTMYPKVNNFLDTSEEFKNIYFEVISNEE